MTRSNYDLRSVEELEPLGRPLRLRCGACGKAKSYDVGRLFIDPEAARDKSPEVMQRAFAFSGYFHCAYCQAGGPWELVTESLLVLVALMLEAVQTRGKSSRVHFSKIVLFDGTESRWPTQGEAHLKKLIEANPDDYYVWGRLGNLYKTGGAPGLAEAAYREALARNPNDVEALHSLGEIAEARHDYPQAGAHFHQVLLRARHAPARTPRAFLETLVADTVGHLTFLAHTTNNAVSARPPLPADEAARLDALVRSLVGRDEEDVTDALTRFWMTGRAPPMLSPRLAARPAGPVEVGRNDPCPCGSGKKYKKCCGIR